MEWIILENSFVDILSQIFYTLLSDVFAPILKEILNLYMEYVLTVFFSIWCEFLLGIFNVLCGLVDFVENIFNVFAGISTVEVHNKTTYLLDAFFQMEEVTRAFTLITVLAVGISFLFTIFKTAKSISDMALEDKNPISKVLGDGMRAAITFMLIPFLCIFLLQAASIVTNQAVASFNAAQHGESSIGTIIFLSASLDADKETTKPRSGLTGLMEGADTDRSPSIDDTIREPYLVGTKNYRDLLEVKKDFYAANFHYVQGFASAILLLFILAGASLIFIRRLFELLLLYLVSPLFVSTIPLDDGVLFSKWRELFVAKFFSGFGVIFSMRYYLLLVPSIASKRLCLYPANLPNAVIINTVLKLFLIIGGAWAVYKSQHLMMQILNPEAAMADEQAGALIQGIIVGSASTAASMAMSAASGGATTALGAMGSLGGGAGGSLGKLASAAGELGGGSKNSDENQRFTGK